MTISTQVSEAETEPETVRINPDFSVFRLVDTVKSQTLLQHRQTMSVVSHQIENATIKEGTPSRIFAGFQRMSKFIPQIARYNQLALNAERVYVFGVPDIPVPAIPNVTYIPLKPTDQLAREWFLVSYAADYYSALATEEITDIDDPDNRRVFHGIWSFDLPIVSILHDWLTMTVKAPEANFTVDQRSQLRQVRMMSRTINRLSEQISRLEKSNANPVTTGEVKTVIKDHVAPSIEALSGLSPVVLKQDKQSAILFCDIRNFTMLSEQLDPAQLVNAVLTPYLTVVSTLIEEFGGRVDKFLGDGVLAVFDLDTTGNTNHVLSAARAIIAQATTLHHRISGAVPVDVGIGLTAGTVIEGQVGPDTINETTVIGDPVNLAQRLSDLGKNDIWMDQQFFDLLVNTEKVEPAQSVTVKGKSRPITAYQLPIIPPGSKSESA